MRSKSTLIWLAIGGEEEVGSILLRQPADLVDLFLNFQAFQVVKLRLMALKGAVNVVLSPSVWLVLTLKKTKDKDYTIRGI